MKRVSRIQLRRLTRRSVSRGDVRTNADARGLRVVVVEEKQGRFERAVEDERVQGDVHEAQDPRDDEQPVGPLVDHE